LDSSITGIGRGIGCAHACSCERELNEPGCSQTQKSGLGAVKYYVPKGWQRGICKL